MISDKTKLVLVCRLPSSRPRRMFASDAPRRKQFADPLGAGHLDQVEEGQPVDGPPGRHQPQPRPAADLRRAEAEHAAQLGNGQLAANAPLRFDQPEPGEELLFGKHRHPRAAAPQFLHAPRQRRGRAVATARPSVAAHDHQGGVQRRVMNREAAMRTHDLHQIGLGHCQEAAHDADFLPRQAGGVGDRARPRSGKRHRSHR